MTTAYVEPKRADDFYSTPEWREARARAINRAGGVCAEHGPSCQVQRFPGDPHRPRAYVDHITEIKDGGDKLDPANLQVLCASAHTAKTHRARVERQRR
jgi:5-methylcytosine-specific restriction endonuclease McrA